MFLGSGCAATADASWTSLSAPLSYPTYVETCRELGRDPILKAMRKNSRETGSWMVPTREVRRDARTRASLRQAAAHRSLSLLYLHLHHHPFHLPLASSSCLRLIRQWPRHLRQTRRRCSHIRRRLSARYSISTSRAPPHRRPRSPTVERQADPWQPLRSGRFSFSTKLARTCSRPAYVFKTSATRA